MNKFAVVLTVAAVATLSGCKDPNFKRGGASNTADVRLADTQPATPAPDAGTQAPDINDAPAPVIAKKGCLCAPGTKHAEPCKCGAEDCNCIVEVKAVPPPPAEPEYSIYVVQNGDYLAKISKKCNVTIAAIKRINNLKSDTIRIGQKLKIPGKLPESMTAPAAAAAAQPAAAAKKSYTPYTGATKEYVVKNGDTLGAIAYGNGINIRQLKELNGLSSDVLRIGQKLKIPADGKAAAKTTVAEAKSAEAAEKPAADVPASADAEAADAAAPAAVDEAKGEQAAAPAEQAVAAAPGTTTYVVQEGEDMTTMAIRFGVAAGVIRELNNLPDDAQLKPGQVIKLPADVQQ